ncbi:MAG: DnaJ domain-containing protein [Proteobacteria bacterium]|nr:DnaJ domain-containing protein [Pseudomonadota bacterium]
MFDDLKDFDPLLHERKTLKDIASGITVGPYLVSMLLGLVTGSALLLGIITATFAATFTLTIMLGKNSKHTKLVAAILTFSLWSTVTTFWAMFATVPSFDAIHALSSIVTVTLTALLMRFWAGRLYDKALRVMNERIRKARENGTYHDPFESMFAHGFSKAGFGPGFGTRSGAQQRAGFGPNNPRNAWQKPFEDDIRRARERAAAQQQAGELAKAYETLGVASTAGKDDVKKAHRKLVAMYHPDRTGNAGTAKMATVNAAKDLIYKANGWT